MPRTPDRFVGPREEEEIQFDDRTVDGPPAAERRLRYLEEGLHLFDLHGVMNLRDSYARQVLPFDLTVPPVITWFAHDVEVDDGVEITVDDGGEMLVL